MKDIWKSNQSFEQLNYELFSFSWGEKWFIFFYFASSFQFQVYATAWFSWHESSVKWLWVMIMTQLNSFRGNVFSVVCSIFPMLPNRIKSFRFHLKNAVKNPLQLKETKTHSEVRFFRDVLVMLFLIFIPIQYDFISFYYTVLPMFSFKIQLKWTWKIFTFKFTTWIRPIFCIDCY